MKPTFFESPAKLRAWFAKHHESDEELWIGFYKVGSGRGGITYKQALDEALAYGWIDGLQKSVDSESYMLRFTKRKPKSNWSETNIKRMKELIAEGRVARPGLTAFESRDEKKAKDFARQKQNAKFDPAVEKKFKANIKAWSFFEKQPPGYKRMMTFFVMSAKKEETRERRLKTLIDACARGERIEPMTPRKP